MAITINKYQPDDILEFIKATYKQQQKVDFTALKGYDLTFTTTIDEWRDICDLLQTDGLAKAYDETYALNFPLEIWRTVLEPSDEKTIGDLCRFIAHNATKEILTPVNLLGQKCATAATYRMLIANLKKEGVPTESLRPTSNLQPVLHKHAGAVITAVNLLNPHALPSVQYKANILTRIGLNALLAMAIATIVLAILESKIGFITGGLIVVSNLMLWIGSKLPPKQLAFEGIVTLRDLVNRIEVSETPFK